MTIWETQKRAMVQTEGRLFGLEWGAGGSDVMGDAGMKQHNLLERSKGKRAAPPKIKVWVFLPFQ